MRKKEVICAFYNPQLKHFDKYHSFMSVIVEHKSKIKPLYFEDKDGAFLIVFYRHKLKNISKYFSEENMEFYERVMTGRYRHCVQCGCGYLSYLAYTYRSNCGCIGKSFECEICQEYADEAVQKISDFACKHGTKKTLLRLLNDEFFKHESVNMYEDLPF